MANFSSFGQAPVGKAGPTTQQLPGIAGGGIKSGTGALAGLFPLTGNRSTVPFYGGGNVSPGNLPAGLNLGNGIKSLGINAKSPDQNVTPPPTTLPKTQVSTGQGNSGGATSGTSGGGSTSSPYQMTPQEASGGAAGIAAYNARIAAMGGSAPVTPPNNAGANTYSGGVNANGQTLPGYTPQAPATPNTGTSGTGTNGYGGTVPSALSTLFGAANDNTGINAVTAQENQLLGDYATTPGLPQNIEQGRAGQVEQIGNSLIQNLLTSRGQQIGAATSALGAVAPITGVPYGTQTILPGQTSSSASVSGAAVSPTDPFYQTMQTYASALANNQGSAIPSSVSGNPALMAQLLQMAQQINPNFNYNTATGVGSAQQSNAATAGTAVTNMAASGLSNAYTAYQSLNAAYTGVQNMGNLLYSTMSSNGINTQDPTALNASINSLKSQFSSTGYAQFISTLTNTANQYQAILTSNGATTPTAADQSLLSILNPNYSMNAIQASLNQLNNEIYTGKLLPAQQLSNQYLSTLNGGTSANGSNTSAPSPYH